VNPRAKSSGLCAPHYRRLLKGADLTTPFQQHAPAGTPPYDKVMSLSVWEGECLVFTGTHDANGYGKVSIPGSSKLMLAHRVVMEHHHGPSKMLVLHSCDNPPCVRVEHLHYGTQQENIMEAVERNRMAAYLAPRITDEQVAAIRASTERQVDIAKAYGVSQSYVSQIRSGKYRR